MIRISAIAGIETDPLRTRGQSVDVSRNDSSPVLNSSASTGALFCKALCACGGGCPACQAKSSLNISQPNDPAEIEADQIADKVMRMPDEAISRRQSASSKGNQSIQMKPG